MLVLREYHTAMGVLVDKFEDTVERFVGDGLLAIFNDPLPCPDPSLRAVRMAVEMRDAVAKLAVPAVGARDFRLLASEVHPTLD